MNDLISKSKLIALVNGYLDDIEEPAEGFDSGIKFVAQAVKRKAIDGTLDPDTEPITDIQPGDKVEHIKNSHYGIGNVISRSASGVSLRVGFGGARTGWVYWEGNYKPSSLRKVVESPNEQ
ncbi:hypothetical protein [Gorillibacterium sp. CAU 1737]|uniref:hypothetical protein n=1 Tax=Gorillibacterium sp. CAU 1737 TaxID=3140362 RepID=UPI003261A3A0